MPSTGFCRPQTPVVATPATIAGPLVEIPVMLALVHVSKSLYRGLFKNGPFRWSKGSGGASESSERIWTEKQLGSS